MVSAACDKKTMLIKKTKQEEAESQNSNGVWMAFFCLFVCCLFVCVFLLRVKNRRPDSEFSLKGFAEIKASTGNDINTPVISSQGYLHRL